MCELKVKGATTKVVCKSVVGTSAPCADLSAAAVRGGNGCDAEDMASLAFTRRLFASAQEASDSAAACNFSGLASGKDAHSSFTIAQKAAVTPDMVWWGF